MRRSWLAPLAALAIAVPLHPAGPQPPTQKVTPRLDHYGDPLPEHALLRIGTTRLRPGGVVTAMTFTSDGKRLVTINATTGGHVWEVATGKKLQAFSKPLEVTPYASRIKTGVYVLSPDGSRAAIVEVDKVCRVFDTVTGATTHTLDAAVGELWQVRISPDKKRLAILDQNRGISLWDLEETAAKKRWSAAPKDSYSNQNLAFSPDSNSLVVYSGGAFGVWDTASGRLLRGLNPKVSTGRGISAALLAVSPDGKTLITSELMRCLTLCDLADGKMLRSFAVEGTFGDFVDAAIFTPDGKAIVMAGGNHFAQVLIYELDGTSRMRGEEFFGHFDGTASLAVSPDHKILAMGDHDGSIRFWDFSSRKQALTFEGHDSPGVDVRFSTNNTALISIGSGHTRENWGFPRTTNCFDFWNPLTGKHVRKVQNDRHYACLSGDGQTLAGYLVDEKLVTQSTITGKLGPSLRVPTFGRSHDLIITNDGNWVAMVAWDGSEGIQVTVWDARSGQVTFSTPIDKNRTRQHAFTDDGRYLIDATYKPGLDEHEIVFWDCRSGRKCVRRFHWPAFAVLASKSVGLAVSCWGNGPLLAAASGHQVMLPPVDFISQGSISPNGRLFAPLSRVGKTWDPSRRGRNAYISSIPVWELATSHCVRCLRAANEEFGCMVFSPDGRSVAAGAKSGNIYLWHLVSEIACAKLAGHQGSVFSLGFSPDGKRLVSGSDDTTIIVWDVARWTNLANKPTIPLENSAAKLWSALGDKNSANAFAAIGHFLHSPKEAVSFFRQKVRPFPQGELAKLVEDLDSKVYAQRQTAMSKLELLGLHARPALHRVLEGMPTLEVLRRAQLLFAKLENQPYPPDILQTLRALEILEVLGTPDAIELLESLSRGEPEAWLTEEAAWALKRVRKRMGQ